jgi:excisionase family DNA binding protein
MERLYNVDEAASRLGVAVITVRRWTAAGRLSHRRLGPKLLRYSDSDIREFLEHSTVPAGSAE